MLESICPLKMFHEIVGGKWKQSIICILESGEPVRYNEIRRRIPDITNMMLSQSLKGLEEHGIICRKQYDEMPVRVEYSLTEEGISLLPVLAQMSRWGGDYINRHEEYLSSCESCHLTARTESQRKKV